MHPEETPKVSYKNEGIKQMLTEVYNGGLWEIGIWDDGAKFKMLLQKYTS